MELLQKNPFSFVFILLCCASVAAAHSYYLAPNGNDHAAGTISSPWKTMSASASKMHPGDTAYLRGGTYNQDEAIRASGTGGKRLTFRAYANELPLFIGPSLSTGQDVDTIRVYGKYITIDGLAVTNHNDPGQAIWIADSAAHVTISHCNIFGARGVGILVSGNDNLIYRNNVHDQLATAYASITSGNLGIYVEGGRNSVRSNNVYKNSLAGIQIYRGYTGLRSGNIVEYNYVYANGFAARAVDPNAPVFGVALGGNEESNTVRRNRICDNAGYGIILYDNMPNEQITNNITCYNQGGGFALKYPGTGSSALSNISYADSTFALASADGATSNSNDFFVPGGTPHFLWNGKLYSGLSNFQQASGQDADSVIADPQFTNLPANGFQVNEAMTYNFCNVRLPLFCNPVP